ncbi:MAG TPA: hypothetical protein DF984_07950 [Anaerolineaceae bacterium]|nr:hypothetical protein [Anaerolineaceae bacterium]
MGYRLANFLNGPRNKKVALGLICQLKMEKMENGVMGMTKLSMVDSLKIKNRLMRKNLKF